MELINGVAVVWPFSLLLARQDYTLVVLVIFTIAIFVGAVLVLLIAVTLAAIESAGTRTRYSSDGRMQR